MRFQNIGTIRLILAALVVFSHSFLLAEGNEENEPFVMLFGPGNILGLYGVFGFFVISGFLVTRSFKTRAAWWSYLASRVLRIFPALIVAAVACAFVLGPVVTTLPLAEYFTDRSVFDFVVSTSNLSNTGGVTLPGVQFSQGPVGDVVMGTLWTLRPEFACYVLVLLGGLIGALRLPLVLAAVAVGLWTHTEQPGAAGMLGYLGVFFAVGSALYLLHERWRPGRIALAAAGAGLLATAVAGYPHEGFVIFGSVLLVQLATTDRISLGQGDRFGDLSYGIYLYGWPVQQAFVWWFDGDLGWLPLFALSFSVSAVLALASWHLVEAPALRIARWARRRAQPAPPRSTARAPVNVG